MNVGDLVKCENQLGILIKQLSCDPFTDESWWTIQWTNGRLDTINSHILELINESR
jgi:hypothetical protein